MDANQITAEIANRIAPTLEELGVEAFVFVGYVSNGEGKISKITFGTNGHAGANPAYEDGLRNMNQLAMRWGMGQL